MTFFKLTAEYARTLRAAKLTLTEWRLWSYLITLAPFGDRYQELPELLTILAECGISKASFYRAIARFQELELFDFQSDIKFRSLSRETEVSTVRLESHPCDKSLSRETGVSPVRQKSQPCDSQSSKCPPEANPGSPQTYSEKKEDSDSLSEGEKSQKVEQVQEGQERERENFLSFCFRKAGELPKPPVLVEKWIERHQNELMAAFSQENSLSADHQNPGGEREKTAAAFTKLNDSAVSVVKKVYTPAEIEELWQRQRKGGKRRNVPEHSPKNPNLEEECQSNDRPTTTTERRGRRVRSGLLPTGCQRLQPD